MNSSILDNDYWIAEFNKGNPEALNYVFSMHHRPLCYFAEQLTRHKHESEDIVAEAFMKIWTKRQDFETMQNIKAFLYIATRNACLDFLKHIQRRNASHKEIFYLEEDRDEDDVLHSMIESEVLQQVHAEIEKLPRKLRQIFKLAFFEGLDTWEIADKLNLSIKTVRNQKGRAIQQLRLSYLSRSIITAALIYFAILRIDCQRPLRIATGQEFSSVTRLIK
jgi:RNA polymerase sigma-70 factor (family 1)